MQLNTPFIQTWFVVSVSSYSPRLFFVCYFCWFCQNKDSLFEINCIVVNYITSFTCKLKHIGPRWGRSTMNLKVKMFTEDGDNQIRVLLPYHKTITGFPQWKDKKELPANTELQSNYSSKKQMKICDKVLACVLLKSFSFARCNLTVLVYSHCSQQCHFRLQQAAVFSKKPMIRPLFTTCPTTNGMTDKVNN